MEDDVLFSHNWREALESFDRVDDEAWDLVLLNASEAMTPEDTWLPCTHQWLTGAYILSRKGAKWLLANFREKKWEADCMTWCLQDQGHSYAYFPWPVIQEGIDSTIGSDVQANRAKVLSLLGERVSNYS
jgi:hypothetical protein